MTKHSHKKSAKRSAPSGLKASRETQPQAILETPAVEPKVEKMRELPSVAQSLAEARAALNGELLEFADALMELTERLEPALTPLPADQPKEASDSSNAAMGFDCRSPMAQALECEVLQIRGLTGLLEALRLGCRSLTLRVQL